MTCPPSVQRLGGIWAALARQHPTDLLLTAQALGVGRLPRRYRGPDGCRRFLYERAVASPEFAERLARALSARCCGLPRRPRPEEVVELLRRRPADGLIAGLLWGLGEEIADPDWVRAWQGWLEKTAGWRRQMEGYEGYAERQEAMELAEALVAEAEREHRETVERLRAALRAMARACRQRLRAQDAELKRLREENARLRAALRQDRPALPLAGRCVLVVGDPRHAAGYRELLARYGAEAVVCDGQDPQAARRALRGRYDAVVLVTAWTAHAVQELVRKHQPSTRVVFVNRCGVGEMQRAVVAQLLPALARSA